MSATGVKVVGRSAQSPSRRGDRPGRQIYGAAIGGGVVLVALVLVLAASLLGTGAGRAGDGISQPGPARAQSGLPVGFTRSGEGAEAMAARFALVAFGVLDGRLGTSPATIASVYATPAYRATLAALLEQTAAQRTARAEQWSQVRYRRAVLGTRLLSYTPTAATVDTWEIVMAVLGRAPAVSDQFVEQWRLQWSGGDWKLAGAPSGEPGRMGQAELAEVLETFNGRGDATPGY